MSVGTAWIAVGLGATLEPGTSTGAIVAGTEYVVWRESSGRAHVWEDRCPHRGMRMSFGFVRGDHLACLYHGWQYDTAGQCRFIPAHPDLEVPKTIRIPAYAVVEAQGLIWSTLAPDDAATPPLPGLPDGPVTPLRSLYVDRRLEDVVTALGATGVPPFGLGGGAEPSALACLSPAARVWVLTTGSDRLLVAGQEIGPDQSALHLVILGDPSMYAGAGQIHFAQWAETFRHHVETRPLAIVREVA